MSHALVLSRALIGIEAPLVEIETHISAGLPKFSMVGLPEASVKESKERVRSALINSGFEFPGDRITVNLAPADLPKEGSRFDLAIALSLLLASKQIHFDSKGLEFAGELSLSAELRSVQGVLPMAINCQENNHQLFIPLANATQAGLLQNLIAYGAKSLLEVIAHLTGRQFLERIQPKPINTTRAYKHDINDVIGQDLAKRALTIAASGHHHLLLSGPPGTGKTMLASRLNSLLPDLEEQELLEKIAIESLSCHTSNFDGFRNFRQPHHTASAVALVGGGSSPKPGEISMAHHGVLFLDELPEFSRHVLEVLREPLETGEIHISRAKAQVTYPANFQLIAAMNPCPCGFQGDPGKSCRCTPAQISHYQNKISGPLLDRIDLHTQVFRLNQSELLNPKPSTNSQQLKQTITTARDSQMQRQGKPNGLLSSQELKQFCSLSKKLNLWFCQIAQELDLSARSVHKTLKVARTISDLKSEKHLSKGALLEALSYRKQ